MTNNLKRGDWIVASPAQKFYTFYEGDCRYVRVTSGYSCRNENFETHKKGSRQRIKEFFLLGNETFYGDGLATDTVECFGVITCIAIVKESSLCTNEDQQIFETSK